MYLQYILGDLLFRFPLSEDEKSSIFYFEKQTSLGPVWAKFLKCSQVAKGPASGRSGHIRIMASLNLIHSHELCI